MTTQHNLTLDVAAIQDLGCVDNIDVINDLVSLDGKTVIDAGCGGLTFTQLLVESGANVLAIDPDPHQARLNREKTLPSQIEFIETGADHLPTEDNSIDGVFFSYSLHHIPKAVYPAVFAEVQRVLHANGFILVIEPTDCPLNQIMRLFHDEEQERRDAQIALHELAAPHFQFAKQVRYHSFRQYESYDEFVGVFTSKTFNPGYTEADVRHPKVQNMFERLGQPNYRFESPKQLMLLQNKKQA